jgi:anionic cell wall polymer biosynthesis LytR-Cps2A-Psr (LCP) family protein
VRVNFEGFIAIVDAAGGVTIDVRNAMIDSEYPTSDFQTTTVEFRPGRQHMDGARALQYVRIRHGSSDFSRIERQQEVLLALIRQLTWPGNWTRFPAVYRAFAEHVETDVTLLDVLAVAPAVLWVGPEGVDNRAITTEMVFHTTTSNGGAILEPDWSQIDPVLHEMFLR